MKYYIIIPLLFLSYLIVQGQQRCNCIDIIKAKGYILKEVAKHDILAYRKSQQRQIKHKKSFDLPIDVIGRYLFIQCDYKDCSISDILDSIQKKKLTKFFLFCPVEKPYVVLKEICESDIAYQKFVCNTPVLNSQDYYEIKGYKTKLYEIYYIEGNWLKIKYNQKLNYLTSAFKIEYLDMNADYIDLYYLLNYTDFKESPEINIKGIRKWE